MAATITTSGYLTDVSMCESITGWAGGIAQMAADGSTKIQGSYSLGSWIDLTTSAIEYYTISDTDLRGEHIYVWMFCTGVVDTKANGGFRIVLYTDASNYATFYVGGNDTASAGWNLFCCSADATPDLTPAGTFDPQHVTRIGVQFKTLTNAEKRGVTYMLNCFWDAVRYGTGYKVTSGASDGIGLEEIYAIDNNSTYKYGVVRKEFGVYIVQGKLVLGDSAGTSSIDFEDSNQLIVFPDNDKASTTFYGIDVVGNSTGTTNFTLGEDSGGSGISGCTLKAVGDRTFSFDVSNSNNDVIGLYGSNFINVGTITLPSNHASKEMFNCNITMNDGVIIDTCETTNCNFIDADDEAVIMDDNSHNLTDSNFIANPNAVRITAAGTYDFDNLKFTGNTVDVDNTSGGAVTVNLLNGSNATTYTGNTTLVASPVTTQITVKDLSTGSVIESAKVLVWVTDDANYFYQASVSIAGSGTTATVTHSTHGLSTGDFVIIEGVTNDDDYNGVFEVTVTDGNTYTYTTSETLGSTPATGTITSTFALISDDTNASGIVSDTRVLGSDQAIAGWVRKSSGSPYYAQGVISGTVDSDSGISLVIQLARDE